VQAFLASEMCELQPRRESLTRSLLERIGVLEWKGRGGVISIAQFLSIPSFGGPHTGLCHQGQGPKTIEATISLFEA
jgi:hypothetical protein